MAMETQDIIQRSATNPIPRAACAGLQGGSGQAD
jgi:hypothetical protein